MPLTPTPTLPLAAAGFRPSPAAARLDTALRRAAWSGRPLLGGCLPAGWPLAAGPRAAAWSALAGSCDLVEVALPTPDAYLDGGTLRGAYAQALAAGYGHDQALDLIGGLAATGTPVLAMAYWHVIAQYGPARMAAGLSGAGAAGVVIPDLPASLASSWARTARAAGIHTILLAPPGDPGGLAAVAAVGTGAVYLPAAAGVTGTSAAVDPGLAGHVREARDATGLPVITGIGITSPGRAAAAAAASASGIVIGSAFAREVAARPADPGGAVRDLAAAFSAALPPAASPAKACAAPA